MAIELDMSQDEMRERDEVPLGKCMLVMSEFKEYATKTGNHKAVFEVVAHEDPKAVGLTLEEVFPQMSSMTWKLRTLAVAAGLTTMEELQKAKAEGRGVPLEFQDAVNKAMFATIATDAPKTPGEKGFTGLGGRIYHLTDKKAGGHPFSIGILKRSGLPLESIPAYVEAEQKAKAAKAGAAGTATGAPTGGGSKPATNAQQRPATTTQAARPATTSPAKAATAADEFGLD